MAPIHQVDIRRIGLDSVEPTAEDLLTVGKEIAESFRSTGFAYIRNHGISQQLQDDTFNVAKSFFELDESKKLAFERFVKTGYNGYTPTGGENGGYKPAFKEGDKAVNLAGYKECFDLFHFGKVETEPGVWIEAEPLPDTILINIGDMLDLWTSGKMKATNHRVVIPKDVSHNTVRQSIAYFVTPDDGTTVAPLDGDPRYQPIDAGAYLRKQYAATYPTFANSPFK